MPRGNPRPLLTFRCSISGHRWVSDLMAELGVGKTDVMRAIMAVAKTHETELKYVITERKHEST